MYRPRSLLAMTRDNNAVTHGNVNAVPSGKSATASANGKNGNTATADTGTGIGLSIVQNLVTAHHGVVQVESKLNAGTRVTVSFPASPASELSI